MLRITTGIDVHLWKRTVVSVLIISMLDMRIHGQVSDCNMLVPTQCIYETLAVHNNDLETEDCNTVNITGTQYTFCNHPVVLTDNNPGPGTFNSIDSSSYYLLNSEGGRMMFVFPVATLLRSMQLFYYVDSANQIGRPKIRVVLVNETFEINDTISYHHPGHLLDIEFDGVPDGLKNHSLLFEESKTSVPITTKVVLEIQRNKIIKLALSEITFCTAEPVTSLPEEFTPSTMSSDGSSMATMNNSNLLMTTDSSKSTSIDVNSQQGVNAQRQNNLSCLTLAIMLFLPLMLLR